LENLGYLVPGIALSGEDAIKKAREKSYTTFNIPTFE
jgi:hypothetical protein